MTKSTARKAGRAGQQKPSENEEPEKKSPGRQLTSLREQGDRLPIGIFHEGRVHKDLAIKPWRTREEKALGKKVPPDAGMAEHVGVVVSNMCSRIGPHDMDAMDDAQKKATIAMMYMGDVFYVYCYLRFKSVSEKLHLAVSCPRVGCGVEFPWTGDIGSLDVMAVEDLDDIMWQYELQDPIEIRKQQVSLFHMAYPKWSVLDSQRGNTNEAEVKAATIQSAIVGFGEDPSPTILAASEVDELSKRDFELIQAGINDHFLGPKMAVEGKCSEAVCTKYKRGGHEFIMPIDWSYKHFFGSSSLSPTSKT